MKRFLTMCLLIVCAGTLTAENAGIILSNSEAQWLYYAVDPSFGTSPVATADLFATVDRFKFSALAPGANLRLEGLSPGAHSVVGFWAAENTSDYAVWSLSVVLQEGQMKNFTLKKSAAVASRDSRVTTPKDTLPGTPIVIDNSYADWNGFPAVAVFPPAAMPQQFTYQAKEGVRNLPIRNSSFWGKGGTQLLTVKALFSRDALSLYFSAASPLADGLSIFLYLFDDRQSTDLNLYTIEIPVADGSGANRVLLWQRGVKEPLPVGVFQSARFYLEAAIDLAKLPAPLRDGLFEKYSFDLKTSYYDNARSFHEEFYFTSIYCRDIYLQK